jgi:hypothetical protein
LIIDLNNDQIKEISFSEMMISKSIVIGCFLVGFIAAAAFAIEAETFSNILAEAEIEVDRTMAELASRHQSRGIPGHPGRRSNKQ